MFKTKLFLMDDVAVVMLIWAWIKHLRPIGGGYLLKSSRYLIIKTNTIFLVQLTIFDIGK